MSFNETENEEKNSNEAKIKPKQYVTKLYFRIP